MLIIPIIAGIVRVACRCATIHNSCTLSLSLSLCLSHFLSLSLSLSLSSSVDDQ